MNAFSDIFGRGGGAVSPAGSGVPSLWSHLSEDAKLTPVAIDTPEGFKALKVFKVPPIMPRPQLLSHPRLRRSSRISQFAACAALEAIGGALPAKPLGAEWAVVVCMTAGCLDYSRRFYEEVLRDPATASPLLFPETVFNAPASHLATVLGITGSVDTLVGDETAFLDGIQLAREWLGSGEARNVLVVATEEADWIASYAARCFSSRSILCEGAAALWLSLEPPGPSDPVMPIIQVGQVSIEKSKKSNIGSCASKLGCYGRVEVRSPSNNNRRAVIRGGAGWRGWDSGNAGQPVASPGNFMNFGAKLGEGLSLHGGWQCAVAVELIRKSQFDQVLVKTDGFNAQSMEVLLFNPAGTAV